VTFQVLVVEDDHGLRGVLARGLREGGYLVVTAADGASAMRSMNPDIDAIVLDIGLPDADGRDVCQAMRASGVNVPVLFLTARGGVTDRLSGFAAGGDDYLSKPFHLAELVARLHVALRRAGPTATVQVGTVALCGVANCLRPGGLTAPRSRTTRWISTSPSCGASWSMSEPTRPSRRREGSGIA
jgi:two-component system response regulator MprA